MKSVVDQSLTCRSNVIIKVFLLDFLELMSGREALRFISWNKPSPPPNPHPPGPRKPLPPPSISGVPESAAADNTRRKLLTSKSSSPVTFEKTCSFKLRDKKFQNSENSVSDMILNVDNSSLIPIHNMQNDKKKITFDNSSLNNNANGLLWPICYPIRFPWKNCLPTIKTITILH